MSEWRPQAILFDLDDTLSDHLACARAGLVDQQRRHPEVLGSRDLAELESIHSETLELTHSQMMAGELSMEEARLTRTQRFWSHFGVDLSDAQADAEQQHWREAYAAAHGVVRGTYELLDRLSSDGYRLGVITNNLEQEQHAKLKRLGIYDHFEMLAISEEVGVPKPDPHIFNVALERMQLAVDDVMMVGDSLTSDIAGALGVGMRCVWIDRHGKGADAAPSGVSAVISPDFSDLEASLLAITQAG